MHDIEEGIAQLCTGCQQWHYELVTNISPTSTPISKFLGPGLYILASDIYIVTYSSVWGMEQRQVSWGTLLPAQ